MNITRSLLITVGLLVSLSIVGVDLTALSVLGGAIGVGIGLGLQKLASNYVSGFVVLSERAIRIGDVIKVDGFEGQITDLRARYTVIRCLSDNEGFAIVPEFLCKEVFKKKSVKLVWNGTQISENPLYFAFRTDLQFKKELSQVEEIFKVKMN